MKLKNRQICFLLSIFLISFLLAPLGCRSWKSESEKLKEEITDISAENKKLKKELDNLKTKNSTMHERLAQQSLRMSQLQNEMQGLKKDPGPFRAQVKRVAKKEKAS